MHKSISQKSIWVAALGSALLAGAIAVRAEDAPATQPAKPTTRASGMRLVQPWSKLSDLTDEQKTKIIEIHKKATSDEKAIREKETDDIKALLTDAQKAELEKNEISTKERMSENAKKKKAEDMGN